MKWGWVAKSYLPRKKLALYYFPHKLYVKKDVIHDFSVGGVLGLAVCGGGFDIMGKQFSAN